MEEWLFTGEENRVTSILAEEKEKEEKHDAREGRRANEGVGKREREGEQCIRPREQESGTAEKLLKFVAPSFHPLRLPRTLFSLQAEASQCIAVVLLRR